jgi:hypothetical protein
MNELIRYSFGEFGNYGSSLVVQEDDGLVMKMENWAYGETYGSIQTREIKAQDLIELGQKLLALGVKLKDEEQE